MIESEQGFRIICMARLTFVPFGLQNALFAVSALPFSFHPLFALSSLLFAPSLLLLASSGSSPRLAESLFSLPFSSLSLLALSILLCFSLFVPHSSPLLLQASKISKRGYLLATATGLFPMTVRNSSPFLLQSKF